MFGTPIFCLQPSILSASVRSLQPEHLSSCGIETNQAISSPSGHVTPLCLVLLVCLVHLLERETELPPEIEEASKRLIDARATLATASKRLGDEHPDVIQGRRTIAALEEEVRQLGATSLQKLMLRPENPAYINLQAQLNSATSSLNALRAARMAVKRRVENYATRLERTPEMEPDYLHLTRDRDTSGQKYQDIRSRLLEAKVSEGLEVQRKGERFSLIDPPGLPEKPDKPNRSAIVLLGFILALAESLDHSIRTPEQLARLTRFSPLAVIPFMPNERDLSLAVKRRRLLKGAGVGAFVMVLALLHVFVMPLDVLWLVALRRFGVG